MNQTVPQQVALFYNRQTTTDWTTNLRHESDKLVYGSLHLLAPGWTMVMRAQCRWCSHRTQGHASSGTRSRRRIPRCIVQWSPRCGSLWAHNLWEGRTRQGCQGPHQRESLFVLHIVEEEAEDQVDEKDDRRKVDSKKRKGDSRRIKHTTWAHEDDACDDVKCALRTPNLSLEPRSSLWLNEEMWRVRCAVHRITKVRTQVWLTESHVMHCSATQLNIVFPSLSQCDSPRFPLPRVNKSELSWEHYHANHLHHFRLHHRQWSASSGKFVWTHRSANISLVVPGTISVLGVELIPVTATMWFARVVLVSGTITMLFFSCLETTSGRAMPGPALVSHLHVAPKAAANIPVGLNVGSSKNLCPSCHRNRLCLSLYNHPLEQGPCHPLPCGSSDCSSDRWISLLLAVPDAVVLRSATLTKDGMNECEYPLAHPRLRRVGACRTRTTRRARKYCTLPVLTCPQRPNLMTRMHGVTEVPWNATLEDQSLCHHTQALRLVSQSIASGIVCQTFHISHRKRAVAQWNPVLNTGGCRCAVNAVSFCSCPNAVEKKDPATSVMW